MQVFSLDHRYWQVAADVLSDIMFNHTFLEDGFKSEKEVVKEEISMYEDNPKSFVIDKIYEEIFENYKNRENYLSSLFFSV